MSLRRTRLRPSLRISSFGNQVELLHQGQVVLDVPVVGDAPVGDAVDVGGDEIDRLALALGLLEAAGEVATKVQVHDDAITGHDNIRAKVARGRTRRCSGSTLRRKPGVRPVTAAPWGGVTLWQILSAGRASTPAFAAPGPALSSRGNQRPASSSRGGRPAVPWS